MESRDCYSTQAVVIMTFVMVLSPIVKLSSIQASSFTTSTSTRTWTRGPGACLSDAGLTLARFGSVSETNRQRSAKFTGSAHSMSHEIWISTEQTTV
jgi:hypothetical protein